MKRSKLISHLFKALINFLFCSIRKQLAATKKRAPKKVISSSVRSLTDGDILYENEFVKLPKQKVKSLKRVKVNALFFGKPPTYSNTIIFPVATGCTDTRQ